MPLESWPCLFPYSCQIPAPLWRKTDFKYSELRLHRETQVPRVFIWEPALKRGNRGFWIVFSRFTIGGQRNSWRFLLSLVNSIGFATRFPIFICLPFVLYTWVCLVLTFHVIIGMLLTRWRCITYSLVPFSKHIGALLFFFANLAICIQMRAPISRKLIIPSGEPALLACWVCRVTSRGSEW